MIDPKIDQRNAMDRNDAFSKQYDSQRSQKHEASHSKFLKNQKDKKILAIILIVIVVMMIISSAL